MTDIESALATIESVRDQQGVVDDLTLASVLQLAESRVQLERIFAPLDATAEVCDRVHAFLAHGDTVRDRSDDELLAAAAGHLNQLRRLLDRGDYPDGAKELVDAALQLPVRVADELAANARQLTGVGNEITTPLAASGSLSPASLDQLVGIDDWYVREAVGTGTVQTNEAIEMAHGLLPDHPHLAYYLIGPAITDPFDFGFQHLLWEAGATLWVSPEAVEVQRGSAPRWAFPHYEPAGPDPQTTQDVDSWLASAGKGGAKAVSKLQAAQAGAESVLHLEKLGLQSLPPGTATTKSIISLSLWQNRFTAIPAEVLAMTWLQNLTLNDNQIESLPAELADALPQLERLNVNENRLSALPENVVDMSSLVRLDLKQNQLAQLPDNIGDLAELEMLLLSGNKLTAIPASLARLRRLTFLDLSNNPLAVLPPEFLLLDVPDATRISLRETELPADLQRADSITKVRQAWPKDWPQPTS